MLSLLILACGGSGTGKGNDEPPTGDCQGGIVSISDTTISVDAGECGSAWLEGRVLGDGELSLELTEQGIVPVITGQGWVEGVAFEGDFELESGQEPRLWRQGYQSWSWSGVTELPTEHELDDWGLPLVGGDGDGTSVIFEREGTSWWAGMVGTSPPEGLDHGAEGPDGWSLLLGQVGATETKFSVSFTGEQVWAVYGNRGTASALEGELRLDPLHLSMGPDPNELWASYADLVAIRVGSRGTSELPPTGWATWYQFYSEVTEADVRANLALSADLPSGLAEIEVFQIDDGWQRLWGDWQAGDAFPSGMDVLAADIEAAGFTPGLWMAPFYVHRDTDTYAEHPDWWVLDEAGEEIVFTNLGSGDYVIIDATHPEAGPWMAQQVADRVAEGWTYLKLDFLYAGAQEGQRYEPVTGTVAYHRGMSLIREAIGDAWLLVCGAPMLPSVGYAEQFRSGADIAFEIDPDPRLDYLRWQARATAARGWANGRWWWNDPDQVIIREPFDDATARGAVVAQAVSGGAWLLGDDLPSLDSDRLALALKPEAVGMRGDAASPYRPFDFVSGQDAGPAVEGIVPDDQVPTTWRFGSGAVALLNMSDAPIEVPGPGGVEVLTQEAAPAGVRTLAPGAGEIWSGGETGVQ